MLDIITDVLVYLTFVDIALLSALFVVVIVTRIVYGKK